MIFYRALNLFLSRMQKKKTIRKISSAVKQVIHKSFKPFRQEAPVNMQNNSTVTPEQLNGADLFVHFTADVIKKDIVFER